MRSRAQVISSRFMNGDETLLDSSSSTTLPPPPPSLPRLTPILPRSNRTLPPLVRGEGSFSDERYAMRLDAGPSELRGSRSMQETGSSRYSRPRARHTMSPVREYGPSTPFHASPLPWVSPDMSKPRSRGRDRRTSVKGRISVRSPFAGR